LVGRRFGLQTVAHIRDMTSHRLERDLVSGKLNVPLTTLPREANRPPANLVQLQVPRKTA
jgi:hypothetical protein